MTGELQISSLGETFLELLKRLEDGISSVIYLCTFLSGLDFWLLMISDFLLFQQRAMSAYWSTSCFSTGIYLPCYSQFLKWKTAEGEKGFVMILWRGRLLLVVHLFCYFLLVFANCSVAFLQQKLLIPFLFSVTTEKFICPFYFSHLENMYSISSSFFHYKC